jgi:hypothetical protein
MSFNSFKRFIKKQHKSEKSKTDLKKGEDIFGLGNKIKKEKNVNKSTKTTN